MNSHRMTPVQCQSWDCIMIVQYIYIVNILAKDSLYTVSAIVEYRFLYKTLTPS